MNACLILNTHCSAGDDACAQITAQCARHAVDVRHSEAPGDAARLAKDAVARDVGRLIVAGGDGTVHEVVNGLGPTFDGVELAVLPCGTGNDLARSLGVQPNTAWDEAVALAAEADAKEADVVRLIVDDGDDQQYVINACSGGFAGDVRDRLTAEKKQTWGALAYWIAGARQLTELDEYEMELTLDGKRQTGTILQIAVANGRTVGGGAPVAPEALINDGKLDLVIAPVQSTVDLLGGLIALGFGRHTESENVAAHQAGEIEIRTNPRMAWSIDGELIDAAERMRFEVMPSAIRLVAAENAPAFTPATPRETAL